MDIMLVLLLVLCGVLLVYYLVGIIKYWPSKKVAATYEDRLWYVFLIEDEQKILVYLTLESDKARETFEGASKQFAAKEVVIVKDHAYAPHRIWKMWIAKNLESRLRSITVEMFFLTSSDEAAWRNPMEKQ